MQRTRRTPLSEAAGTESAARETGAGPAENLTEPADHESAGSPSSTEDPAEAADLVADQPGDEQAGDEQAGDEQAGDAVAPPRSWRLSLLFGVVGLLILGLDQLTKALALQHLEPGQPVEVIGSLLKFTLIRNPGAAFSLGARYTPVISTVQIIVAVGVVWLSRRLGSVGWAVAFGFLFGGAVGNITDRIFREPSPFHGHVVDFLQTPHWAIFNVADVAVTSAAILLVIQTLRGVHLDGSKDGSRDGSTDGSRDRPTDGSKDKASEDQRGER